MYTQTIPEGVALKATHSPSSNEQTISRLSRLCLFFCLSVFVSHWLIYCYIIKSHSLLKKEKQTNKQTKKKSGSCGNIKSTFFYQVIININCKRPQTYRVFSHDVTTAKLVFQNNETAAMLVYQDNPVEVEFFSYAKAFFCSNKFAYMLAT